MKLIKNAAGRLVPTEVNGQKQLPFQGINKYKPKGGKAKPPIRTCINYPKDGNKVVKDLTTALKKAGLKDGDLLKLYEHHLKTVNHHLPNHMNVNQVEVHPEEFMKTPKRSIKRFLYR